MKSCPGTNWIVQAVSSFEHSIVHGERRVAEMDEVVKAIHEFGLPNDMTNAAANWQRRIAGARINTSKDARATGAKSYTICFVKTIA